MGQRGQAAQKTALALALVGTGSLIVVKRLRMPRAAELDVVPVLA